MMLIIEGEVIEVHLLFTMELALSIVLLISLNDQHHEFIVLDSGAISSEPRLLEIFLGNTYLLGLLEVLQVPRPVGVVTAFSLAHGGHNLLVGEHVEGRIVALRVAEDDVVYVANLAGGLDSGKFDSGGGDGKQCG